jgi:hypothetical protein
MPECGYSTRTGPCWCKTIRCGRCLSTRISYQPSVHLPRCLDTRLVTFIRLAHGSDPSASTSCGPLVPPSTLPDARRRLGASQQIPSWSWISTEGAVGNPHLRVYKSQMLEQSGLIQAYFTVVDLPQITPDKSDPFGNPPISCGPVTVKGILELALGSKSGEPLFHGGAPHWCSRVLEGPETAPYQLLYGGKSNPEKAIGSMPPDRRDEVPTENSCFLKPPSHKGSVPAAQPTGPASYTSRCLSGGKKIASGGWDLAGHVCGEIAWGART